MKRVFVFAALLVGIAFAPGCGSSPREAGQAFARSVISSVDSGDQSALQQAALRAEERIRSMSPSAGAEFMEGYQAVVLEWVQKTMP